jgi:hypothetical protein
MPTTDYMSLVLPTEDGSSDTWDQLLNAALEVVDAHDHSTGKGVTVKSAGIEINADLPLGGYALTGGKALDFTAVAAATVSSYACALFANSADNELYWRTSGGTNVQLTSGTSLNAALLGGFTGDYGAGDEEANYASGTGIYNFLQAATTRGKIDCSDIRLFQASAGISNAVTVKSPAALAASYTITMPGAAPASTSLVQMSSAGTLTASPSGAVATTGTVATGALTVTGAATVSTTLGVTGAATLSSTLGVTGAATLSSTLGVTGLITATAGLTAAANQHVTVSGTGRFKHGSMTMVIPGNAFVADDATATYSYDTGSGHWGTITTSSATNMEVSAPIILPAGKRITQIVWNVGHGTGASNRTYLFRKRLLASGASGNSSVDSTTNATSNDTEFTITRSGLTETITAGTSYTLVADLSEADDAIHGVEITFDHP